MSGFIQLKRTKETDELLKDPNAFSLLTVIALRAKRTNDLNVHNLKTGEALIGDYLSYGLTEQRYRTAKANLQKWGLATFKGTNKGTIATLTDSRIYDINVEGGNEQGNRQPTRHQRTSNEPATTNNNDNKETINKQQGGGVEISENIRGRFDNDNSLKEFVTLCRTEQRMREIFAHVDASKNIDNPTGLALKLARDGWQPSQDNNIKNCTLCGSRAFKGNGDGHLCQPHYDDYQKAKAGDIEYGIKNFIAAQKMEVTS